MKETLCAFNDNNPQMNDESWSGRGINVLVVIHPVSHLNYNKLKKNCKSSNFVNQRLNAHSNNIEKNFNCDKCISLFS